MFGLRLPTNTCVSWENVADGSVFSLLTCLDLGPCVGLLHLIKELDVHPLQTVLSTTDDNISLMCCTFH